MICFCRAHLILTSSAIVVWRFLRAAFAVVEMRGVNGAVLTGGDVL